jgi:hydrogenase expression/formation protein HypC
MQDDLMLPGTCTLDHDGCIVCSDAGIPVRVVSVERDDALCEDRAGNRAQIAVELVAPVQVGEVLLTHGGVAIGKIEANTRNLMPDT